MTRDSVNAVHLGYGKDEWGFKCEVLEDPITKKRMAAYSLEVWEERCRFMTELTKMGRVDSSGNAHFAAD
jgi:hypothetical protein